ncbi:D-alanine--D-alanine ligase family protein [Corynebacterium suicordis]|uniref:D-alanine--D-alanine ligase n=1 Tax=Corynebacterium suicordis DSM 45110 TaxID=1121369 RepID=A0ABR9ZIU6_9CORY|nr:D-alanine--D-alanine ligase family protein [Corynebacterium suicordis]MBF4553366.1 D-alanine--D-alanine ligase [Corynebacterium suicordis DSM 45110]
MDTSANTVGNGSDSRAGDSRLRVLVLFGGQSTEHSVSCISAGAVMSHLDPQRYEVIPVGISPDGAWVPQHAELTQLCEQLKAQGAQMPEVQDSGEHVQLVIGGQPGQLRYTTGQRASEEFAQVDVIFPVLHGMNGEDGTIQGLFDLTGVPYVGNGVLASAAGMDKVFTKKLAREAGIPVTHELVIAEPRELTESEQQELGLPVFVKPARGGSSIGISKVSAWEDLAPAVAEAFAHDDKVVIESMIYGSEVECGVLQKPSGELIASVPALLQGTEDGDEGFYGFDAKYVANTVSAAIPAPLDPEMTRQIQNWSVATFQALGCQGLARVDFFVTDKGPVLNEINTMPGFTPISMYPKMFAATDVAYGELLDTLIESGVRG